MWKWVRYVRDNLAGQSPTNKLVMFCLASRADDDGQCYPSVPQIATDSGLSARSVYRALSDLIVSGEIRKTGRTIRIMGGGDIPYEDCAERPEDSPPQEEKRDAPTMEDAVKVCMESGASMEQAKKFWRYNQARGWKKLNGKTGMSLPDLAKAWTDRWERNSPGDYERERMRRRDVKWAAGSASGR